MNARVITARPLVSVVVPVWNGESTLLETLDSVLAQTYARIEIIIVDDGSTDHSREIAANFCQLHPHARLICKDNGGVSSARNVGIAASSGEWIAPVDSDDLWHPTKIQKQVDAALAAPDRPGLVYCWYHRVDEAGNVFGSSPRWIMTGRAFHQMAYRNPVGNGSALLISRECALAIPYDGSLRECDAEGCEDVLIQLRIAREHPIACVAEHLVGYRRRSGSMSQYSARILRSWQLVYDRVAREAQLPARMMRWYRADVAMTVAEIDALHGRRAAVITQICKALATDPVRSLAFLGYRALRAAAYRVRGRRAGAPLQHFNAVDPGASVQTDPDEMRLGLQLLKSIDMRRLRSLARSDDASAPSRRAGQFAGMNHG